MWGSALRPTTKDLASHLGLSRSTVDRVLNGRPGVKAKTVKAVHDAIKELGFERNISAANLARRRIYRFAFLMPRVEGEFLSELEHQILDLKRHLTAENTDIVVHRVLDNDPHQMATVLTDITRDSIDGVGIVAPDSPPVRDAITRLVQRGVYVVRMVSGQTDEAAPEFVGIDNGAAGRTAARLLGSLCPDAKGQVLVVADTTSSPDSAARREGFDEVMQKKFPDLDALPTLETHGDPDRAEKILSSAFNNYEKIVGVYVLGSEAGFALDALQALNRLPSLTVVAHERTRKTFKHLADGRIDALIVQDPGHIARSAVRILRAKCDAREPIISPNEIRIEILLRENLVSQRLARSRDA